MVAAGAACYAAGLSVLGVSVGSRKLGHQVAPDPFFDTVRVSVDDADKVLQQALEAGVNLRKLDSCSISIALDETTTINDVDELFSILNGGSKPDFDALSLAEQVQLSVTKFGLISDLACFGIT